MCCLDCTCIRLLYVFWPAFKHWVATIVLISNISFDNKGKAATPFDILCWRFSNKLTGTLGVLVFKLDVLFFCYETYKKCKNINFLSSFVIHVFQNNKTYLICNLCKRNVVVVVSFTTIRAGTCVFQVWRQTLWRQWNKIVFKIRILLVWYELHSKEKQLHHVEQITPDFKLPLVCGKFFLL